MTLARRMTIALICALVVVGCAAQQGAQLPALNLQQTENIQLIQGGDFEDPEAKAWRFADWPPRPETSDRLIANSIFYTQDVAHSGEWALCLDLTTIEEDRTLLCQQKFGLDVLAPHDGKQARLSAWVILGRGPAGYQAGYSMRHWGPPGAPPLVGRSLRMAASVDEWVYHELPFTLRLGETLRGDITVSARQVPDLAQSPVVYVDDVRLEVIGTPDLAAKMLTGVVILAPDDAIPLKVEVADAAWQAGMRHLRWNVTSPDGLTGYAQGDAALASGAQVVEVMLPELPEGEYAVRLALGDAPGARAAEVLLPFRSVAGPFANH